MSNSQRNFKFVAITGGIGSGKSAVGSILKGKGYTVIDSDQIARKVVEPGQPAHQEIEQKFGPTVINPDRTLNRGALRKIISSDNKMRKILEDITHPRIRALSEDEANKAHAATGAAIIFYEVPLLFESGRTHDFDKVICVVADDDIRIDRVMKRSQLTKDEVRKLIAAQLDQDEKAKLSDIVIDNNQSKSALELSVEDALKAL